MISGLVAQVVNPLLERMSPPSTPAGRELSRRIGRACREAREHRIAAVANVFADYVVWSRIDTVSRY